MSHQQSISKALPLVLNCTDVKHFDNYIYILQQEEAQFRHLKRQVAYDLFELTGNLLLNRDCWNVITDILFSRHSQTMYSIIKQVSPEYKSSMLPFLTAPSPITKSLLVKMAHEMEINLILHKAQICPEFVVRLEQFHIDIINVASETTWVVSTCKVDCLSVNDHLGHLLGLIDDPAVYVDPIDIEDEFLLTLNTASDDSAFTDSFMQMVHNFYYDEDAQIATRNKETAFNAPLELWGGQKASISANQISLELFIAQCVKICTSINGILYLVHQEEGCYCCITRFPNEHFYICVLDSRGSLSMPPFRRDVLLTYKKRKTSYFIEKWGQQMLC
ncbi:hypothetical protein BD408DRAFT_412669 [Parasitella parasitica]|nr:hypothetical protein BD408DRAFT_412669 [Parasitella parasitica]